MSRFETIRPASIKKELRALPLRQKVAAVIGFGLVSTGMFAPVLDEYGLLPELGGRKINQSGCQAGKEEADPKTGTGGCVWTEEELAKQRDRMLKAEEKTKCHPLGAAAVTAFESTEDRINQVITKKHDDKPDDNENAYQWKSPTPIRAGFSTQTIYKITEEEKANSETTGNPRQLLVQIIADAETAETDQANYGVLFYPKENCFKLHDGSSSWDGVFQNIRDEFEPVEDTARLTRALQPFENIVSELEQS